MIGGQYPGQWYPGGSGIIGGLQWIAQIMRHWFIPSFLGRR